MALENIEMDVAKPILTTAPIPQTQPVTTHVSPDNVDG